MTILVTFGTVEGHTAKIARAVADQIEDAGHQVVLGDVREPGFAVPGQFDAIVVCGPIHLNRYPEPIVQFARSFKDALNATPSALITVSLMAASEHEDERLEADGYPYHMSQATGWVPDMRHSAAGALKFLEFNFFKRYFMRTVSEHAGGPVDTSKDYEFTDWDKLTQFVSEFLEFAFSKKKRAATTP